MRGKQRDIEEAGGRLIVIGNGSQLFAQGFVDELGLDFPVLIDPELRAFRAAKLRRGAVELFDPRVPLSAIRALASGARQASVQGDALQLGGTFAIDRSGVMLFEHRARHAGDHAPVDDVVAALRSGERKAPPVSPLLRAAASAGDFFLDPTIALSFDRTGYIRHALNFEPGALDVDLSGKHAVVTGANSGLGFEAALAIARRGASLTLVCRDPERGARAAEAIRAAGGSGAVELAVCDLSNLESVRRTGAELSRGTIDVLIHNAGLLPEERTETADGLELTFATHVVGPHVLTTELLPALERAEDARVIWVSSGGMYARRLNLSDPQWRGRPYDGVAAYAETKRAQVILAELWSDRLGSRGIAVSSMHPGWADTPGVKTSIPTFYRITRPLLRTPEQGADTIVWLAVAEAAASVRGEFYFDRKARTPHLLPGTRETLSERDSLWALCEAFVAERAAA